MNKELQELFQIVCNEEFYLKSMLDSLIKESCSIINDASAVRYAFDFEEYDSDSKIIDLKSRIDSLESRIKDIKLAIDNYEDARDEYGHALNLSNRDYSHAADKEV